MDRTQGETINNPPANGWDEWRHHVLAELVRLNSQQGMLSSQFSDMRADLAGLKVKASLWGLVGGILPAVAALVYVLLR